MGALHVTRPAENDRPEMGTGELLQSAAATLRKLLADCRESDPMRPRLEEVYQAMQYLARLSGQRDPFERRKVARATTLDLNHVVRQLAPSLQRLLGPFISLETELHPAGIWAAIERAQIEQVVIGLVVNAREMLPLGGTIVVRTAERHLTSDHSYRVGDLARGEWAVVEVLDSGTGLDERAALHRFEPPIGDLPLDSSLSLATVATVIRGAGGHVVLDSTAGGRTILAACFPEVAPRRIRQPATGTARAVLVVDDDEWTRLSAARTLRRAGYGVLEAEHADAALELLDDVAGSCVSLVLIDARLAAAGIRPLGDRIRAERPDVDLIVTSRPPAIAAAGTDRRILEKPFTADNLLRAVRERLPAPH